MDLTIYEGRYKLTQCEKTLLALLEKGGIRVRIVNPEQRIHMAENKDSASFI